MARAKTSVTVDETLLAEAREMGVNLSAAAARGIAAEVRSERARRLREELLPEVEAYNRFIERNGVPFADLRAAWPGLE